jgi:hypothetical protein
MSLLRTLISLRNRTISWDQDQRKFLSIIIRIEPVFLVWFQMVEDFDNIDEQLDKSRPNATDKGMSYLTLKCWTVCKSNRVRKTQMR